MMVLTKYMGPTNNRGARVQVTLGSGRKVYVPWDHALDVGPMHAKAAALAIAQTGIRGVFIMGEVPDGTPYAYAVTLVRQVRGCKGRRIRIMRSWGAVARATGLPVAGKVGG